MEKRNSQDNDLNLVNHEMLHSMKSYSTKGVSCEKYTEVVYGKPSIKDKIRIIHPPKIESPVEVIGYHPQPPMIDLAHEKKPSKLVQKLTNIFNSPKFVETAQKVLYGVGVAEFVASSLYGVKVGDSGNEFARDAGMWGQLISGFGLYATYKFAQASSDICTPLLNFNTEIKQNK